MNTFHSWQQIGTDIAGRCTCNSALISSIICFITPNKMLTQRCREKIYTIYALSWQWHKIHFMCDIFSHWPPRILMRWRCNNKAKASELLTLCVHCQTCCLSGLILHWYIRRLSNRRTYQYWINLITPITQTHSIYTNLKSAHSDSWIILQLQNCSKCSFYQPSAF